jgi:hypothetical protein
MVRTLAAYMTEILLGKGVKSNKQTKSNIKTSILIHIKMKQRVLKITTKTIYTIEKYHLKMYARIISLRNIIFILKLLF